MGKAERMEGWWARVRYFREVREWEQWGEKNSSRMRGAGWGGGGGD